MAILVLSVTVILMSFGIGKEHRVRKAETEIEVLSLDRGLEADALDLELLGKAFAHADDHVVDQSAGKTVQRFHAARLGVAD